MENNNDDVKTIWGINQMHENHFKITAVMQ